MAITTQELVKWYVVLFNRAPDKSGFDYWVSVVEQYNPTTEQLVSWMMMSDEFKTDYPEDLPAEDFVKKVYNNILDRDPDADGLSFWVQKLESGELTKYELVEAITETLSSDSVPEWDRKVLDAKVQVGEAFVEKGYDDVEFAKQVMEKITFDAVNTNPDLVQKLITDLDTPPVKADLTTGADTVTGSPWDDSIKGVVSSLTLENTLNSNDKIDGGDGVDTIDITMKGNFAGFSADGYVKNVENVNLTNASTIAREFDATGIEGVQKWTIDAANAAINLKDLGDLGAEIELQNQKSGSFTVSYAEGVTDGTADEQNLTFNNVGTVDNPDTTTNEEQSVAVTINGVESLNIKVKGDNVIGLTADSAKDIALSGDGNVKLTAVPTALKTFDASQATGNVTVDLANASGMTKVVTGSGDDKVTLDVADDVIGNAEVRGGEGNDTLVVKASSAATVQLNQSGFEEVDLANANAVTMSALNTTDIQKVVATTNMAANTTFADLGSADLTVELQGANSSGATLQLDNAGATTLKVDSPSSTATTTTPDTNSVSVTLTNSNAVNMTVADKMNYTGTVNASKASSVNLTIEGQVTRATISVPEATSVVIDKVNNNSSLTLTAGKVTDLNITAAKDLNMSGSSLSALESLIAKTDGTLTLVNLPKIASVSLSGTGSVDLGNLGNTALDYGITVNASGLSSDSATGNVSLKIGTINTKGANVNIDASGVLGAVSIGNINADNGATTAGNVTVDVNGTGGAVTLGAITGKDITIDATNALKGISFTGNVTVTDGGTLDFKGANLAANTVTAVASGSSDVTMKFTGGIQGDTFTVDTSSTFVDANSNPNKIALTVVGDLGTDKLLINDTGSLGLVDFTNGFNISGVETVDMGSAAIVKVKASDITGDNFELNDSDAATNPSYLLVVGTDGNDTLDLSGITDNDSDANIHINLGKGADTVILSGATDKVILDSPFAAADTIKDFVSGTDQIAIDLTKGVAGSKFSGSNKVDTKFLNATKLKVIKFNAAASKVSGVTTLTKKVNTASGNALTAQELLKGKDISIRSSKIVLKAAAGTVSISKLAAPAAATTKTGVLFFYDTDDHELKMIGLKYINRTNGANDSTIDTFNKLTSKVVAHVTATAAAGIVGGDIFIF